MKTKLRENETVALVIRPHVITLAATFLIVVLIIIAGALVDYAGWAAGGTGIMALALAFFIFRIYQRQNNIWVVTNFRVIDEYGLLARNSKECPIDKINNISYRQTVWGRILGYGDVEIQTAAEMGATIYRNVQNPRLLKETITAMQEEFRNYQVRMQASELAGSLKQGQSSDVASEIEKLHGLMVRGIITEEEFRRRKEVLLRG